MWRVTQNEREALLPGHPRCSGAEFTPVGVQLVFLVFAQKLSLFLIFLQLTQFIHNKLVEVRSHDASLIRLNVYVEDEQPQSWKQV